MAKNSPIYEPLKQQIKAQIDRGDLTEGQQLPSEFELVDQFGLSRHQVRQALRELELDGYLERSRGRGSFVAPRSTRNQGIRFSGSRTVAISYPQYASKYSRIIVDSFLQHMANNGYKTVAYNMLLDDHSEQEFLETVQDSGVAGLAIWLIHSDEAVRAAISRFCDSRFPVVLIDRYLTGIDTDCVASDNEDIGYRLTRALINAGHRRIGYVTAVGQVYTSAQDRLAGFKRAMEEGGLADRAVYVEVGRAPEEFTGPVNEVMAANDRPTAFVCVNDRIMRSLHERLTHLGYTVGENIHLACADDDDLLEEAGMPIVAVVQKASAIGVRSAELLIARIERPDRAVQREFIEAGPVLGLKNRAADSEFHAHGKGGGKARHAPAGARLD